MALMLWAVGGCAAPSAVVGRYDFADAGQGVAVAPSDAWSRGRGYGWLNSARIVRDGGAATSDGPFTFAVALPEGDYRVTVRLGHDRRAAHTTIKAETRRLMFENIATAPGERVERTFTTNIRTPRISDKHVVRLNDREIGLAHWDERLTIEFLGDGPAVRSVVIERADDAVTVYLAGDSTVTDQPHPPWNSWGQMLPRFLDEHVSVANHAESGQSLRQFIEDRRLEKLLTRMKRGDYLFIQFAHNDMKRGDPAMVGFAADLERFIAEARRRGATPVLLTPPHRRRFDDAGRVIDTFEGYPDVTRRVAAEQDAALIDLSEMSRRFYETLGSEGSTAAFQDGTHHNNYGSYELARCVVEGIRANLPGLAGYLRDDVGPFDPAHPDNPAAWFLPDSDDTMTRRPLGD